MRCPNCGFDTADFQAILALITRRLQQEGRITYRALQRTLGVDEACLEDVREELVYAKQVALDESGKVLVWREGAQYTVPFTEQATRQSIIPETVQGAFASGSEPPLMKKTEVQPDGSTAPRPSDPLVPAPETPATPPVAVHAPEAEAQKEAEKCFRQSLAIARQRSAKIWELRAALSLSRLWRQQGKKAEAFDFLASVYNWFTEGFGTKDLQEAKALLEELR